MRKKLTSAHNAYSEDTLVEQPAINLFAELGWQTANCYEESFGPGGSLGRETSSEVVLLQPSAPGAGAPESQPAAGCHPGCHG